MSGRPDAAKLRITMLDLDPAPWREVEVALSMTFTALHRTMQAAFLWSDYHLWEFDVAGRRYGVPYDDDKDVARADMTRLTVLRERGISEFLYTYDMGDDWGHRIEVLEFFEAPAGARLPRFLGGEWRTPPEDCGGPFAFPDFLAAVSDPTHADHADALAFYGRPFDQKDIEEEIVEIQMRRESSRRRPKGGS